MNSGFLKHFIVIGSGTLISMVISFFTTPIITRVVNPVDYGQFSIFTMYSSMALMILCFGMDQSLVRFFYDGESDGYRRSLLFKCLKYPLIATFLMTIVVLILTNVGMLEFELGNDIIILLCVYTFIQVIYRFSQLLIRLHYKSKAYSLLGIIQKSVYVILALVLIKLKFISNTSSLIFATVISVTICLMTSIIMEKNIWNPRIRVGNKCQVKQSELLRYAYPYVLSMGITTIFQYIDKISLNIYCSYEQVGIYSSTMTLVNVFAIIQSTFNTLWAPMAIEHYTNDKNDVEFYQKGNQIITVIMFFIGFSLIVCKNIFVFLLGEKYREAAYILPFLIFNPIMYTISETTVGGLVFMKKSNMQIIVSLGACVTNIIGNILLVPTLGCKGAAISTGISYIVLFTLRTVLANKYFYVNFYLKKFYFVTVMALLYAFYNTFYEFNFISILGYVLCVFCLIMTYKKTTIFLVKKLGGTLKNIVFRNRYK